MAKFVKQTSDIADALNRLQGFAENLISTETNRRIQLGREKEARMVDAYKYLISNEQAQINEIEASLDSLEAGLEARGIEWAGLGDEQKTTDFEAILSSANEGAVEMLSAVLRDTQGQKESYEGKRRYAQKVARHIDMFDDHMAFVDPAATGLEHIVEASDVAHAADSFVNEFKDLQPYLDQRLAVMQSKASLNQFQDAWINKVNKDVEGRIAQVRAGNIEDEVRLGILEGGKQQTQEAVGAYLSEGLGSLNTAYNPIMGLQAEISSGIDAETGEELKENSDELKAKETAYNTAIAGLGSDLFPWSTSTPEAMQNAKMFQSSYLAASGLIIEGGKLKRVPSNYNSLVSYLAVANAKYQMAGPDEQAQWRASIFRVLGIDISNTEAIQGIIDMNENARRIDIEEGEIHLDRYMGNIHSSGSGGNEETDDELKEMMQLFLSGQVGKIE